MDERLRNYVNAVCEVKTMDNELLLHGRIRAVIDPGDSDEGEPELEIIALHGGELPAAEYGTLVKIHAFSQENGLLPLGGRVYIAASTLWKISGVTKYGDAERREYFRVRVRGSAKVGLHGSAGEMHAARVLSVSLSGVLLETSAFFRMNDTLYLEDARMSEDTPPFSACCIVRRVDLSRGNSAQYGCRFVGLDEKEADRLYATIFELQRREIRRKRKRL